MGTFYNGKPDSFYFLQILIISLPFLPIGLSLLCQIVAGLNNHFIIKNIAKCVSWIPLNRTRGMTTVVFIEVPLALIVRNRVVRVFIVVRALLHQVATRRAPPTLMDTGATPAVERRPFLHPLSESSIATRVQKRSSFYSRSG